MARYSGVMLMHALAATVIAIQPLNDEPHESSADPYLPMERIMLSAPGSPITGSFVSIQVNTRSGLNILGDAANEPSLAVDPAAPLRMVVGWRQFDTISSNFRQAGYSWSNDGGRTWSDVNVIDPGVFHSDPVLRAGPDGQFYYLSLCTPPNQTELRRSDDGGATWTSPVYAFGGDKPWMAVDASDSIGRGNIYEQWSKSFGCCGNNDFTRSTDGGAIFEEATQIPGQPFFGTMTVGPDGVLFAAGESNFASQKFQVARSTSAKDAGGPVSFELSTVVDLGGDTIGNQQNSPNPAGLLGQAWIAVDRSGGPTAGFVYLLCTIDPDEPGNPSDVMFARSEDAGATWTNPVRVNDGPDGSWAWFGTMDASPDGRIDVVYNDNREAPNGEPKITRTYYTFSIDGGETWAPGVPIGPTWDSFDGWPNGNDKIGDYYDMRSDRLGVDLIYATTYNAEQDVYFARIGPYDCNANGVDDDLDIAQGASTDCNFNGIPDECEIAAGTIADNDGDGVADICACPADFNADGELNILDFIAFQLAWQAQDPQADCDQSGQFDIVDFVCFQGLFQAGCE